MTRSIPKSFAPDPSDIILQLLVGLLALHMWRLTWWSWLAALVVQAATGAVASSDRNRWLAPLSTVRGGGGAAAAAATPNSTERHRAPP